MTDVLADISEIVAFWETSTGLFLVQAYPEDWNPNQLYAEWTLKPSRSADIANGFSTSRDFVANLQELLQRVERKHDAVIDHIVVRRSEDHVLVFWHLPEQQVRLSGRVPVAAAMVPARSSQSEKMEGVA